jgi:hypothetical protein
MEKASPLENGEASALTGCKKSDQNIRENLLKIRK